MKQRHQGASTGQPDGGLGGRVATADHAHPASGTAACLRWAGGVEDADPLELRKPLDGEAPVVGTGRDHDGARGDLIAVLDPDEVTLIVGFEGDRDVRGRRPGGELACLGDGPAGELGCRRSPPESQGSSRSAWRSPPGRRGPSAPARACRGPPRPRRRPRRVPPGRRRRSAGPPPHGPQARGRFRALGRPRRCSVPEARRPPVCARPAAAPGPVTRPGTSPRCHRASGGCSGSRQR